jgi:hypothetical protein
VRRITSRSKQSAELKGKTVKEVELLKQRNERRKTITKEIGIGVDVAIRILKTRISMGEEAGTYSIRTDHWMDNSVLRIVYYRKLDNPEQEIKEDIDFFLSEVRRFNEKIKAWKIEAKKKYNDKSLVYEIVISKK